MVQPLCAGCAKDDSIEIIKRQSYGVLKILMYNSVLGQWKDSFYEYVRSVCFVQRNHSVCVDLPNGTNMSVVLFRCVGPLYYFRCDV